ncbi:hypothetical protein ACXRSW_00010 [Aeromonas dhakensis]|uniref:hypothetical protein n=1 Tax=Aeromonas TaxID=642 RepID=UPI0005BC4909|nr:MULTISPECIES: hypothetical protein [Aeromonas]MDD9308485.1 hypothetical protein [Aeromonas hydrophila]MBL0459537.1 hypothetical protein [Aeromonas dhakensis]MBL0601699.1 hypothetical protein [Aeromonas dhakensis]MBL0656972.1 hypothetical protein [Aeromonas dhakensis]QXC10367.1 hypothetical protein I6L38_10660 [Aeromonas sp. FDAARGOS 1408]
MQSFNWIDIDGIRYSWDGQGSITCTGQFGYHATMAGDRIDALDLESDDGEVAGSLNVDFAAATISFTPARGEQPPHMMVLVGHEQGEQEYTLQSLSDISLQDLLGHSDNIDCAPLTVDTMADPVTPLAGHVLSWDSFHFDDDVLLSSRSASPVTAGHPEPAGSEISINIDMTNQVLDQIPPLHDI